MVWFLKSQASTRDSAYPEAACQHKKPPPGPRFAPQRLEAAADAKHARVGVGHQQLVQPALIGARIVIEKPLLQRALRAIEGRNP